MMFLTNSRIIIGVGSNVVSSLAVTICIKEGKNSEENVFFFILIYSLEKLRKSVHFNNICDKKNKACDNRKNEQLSLHKRKMYVLIIKLDLNISSYEVFIKRERKPTI